MKHHDTLPHTAGALDELADVSLSRRSVFRIGGLTVGLAALIAACGDDEEDANPARVGQNTPAPTLPEGVVNDGVIFRTATSLHYSVIDGHELAKKHGELTTEQMQVVDRLIAVNQDAIEDLQNWTTKAGGKPWTCANPRFDRVILGPIADRFTGRPKEGAEESDVLPSDDPNRDAMALVHAGETLIAEMHQFFVQSLSTPEYRAASIDHGASAARHAAAVAIMINPENLVNPTTLQNANLEVTTTTEAATTTTQNIAQTQDNGATSTTAAAGGGTVQQYYAIPSQFGTLSAVQLAIGAFSNGNQFTINIETPSLNSYIYDYLTEDDCVGTEG